MILVRGSITMTLLVVVVVGQDVAIGLWEGKGWAVEGVGTGRLVPP
jgi:hypothetical protein